MKIITITAIFIVAIGTAHAQQVDTNKKVKLNQREVWLIHASVNEAINRIHKMDIGSLKRDTLDMYLGGVMKFIEDKYRTAKVDTVKGGKK